MKWIKIKCNNCGETGRICCPSCNGARTFTTTLSVRWGEFNPYQGKDRGKEPKVRMPCSKCLGHGTIPCPICKGYGEIMKQSSSVSVKEELSEVEYPYEVRYKSPIINIDAIDKKILYKESDDPMLEYSRQTILEAFDIVNTNPSKYSYSFKIFAIHFLDNAPRYSEQTFVSVEELISLANRISHNHMSDWVQVSLWRALLLSEPKFSELWDLRSGSYSAVIWKTGGIRLYTGYSKVPIRLSPDGDKPLGEHIRLCEHDLLVAIPVN